MSAVRHDRKAAIVALIQENDIRTQRELMDRLAREGFEVTQATVSRDMADLRLEKDGSGVYVMPELLHLRAVIKTQVRETRRAGNQVIVICRPGSAEGVGAASLSGSKSVVRKHNRNYLCFSESNWKSPLNHLR